MPAVPLESLWAVTAPAGPACGPLTASTSAQAAIIGAGYTGLSAALHLIEAGRDVVVLEACEIGARASGANGGQVIPGVKHDPDELERRFGVELGSRLVTTVAGAPDLVFELIARHRIDCAPVRAGWIQPAAADEALAPLAARVEQWRRRGAAVELLSREAVARLTGTTRYCGGLLDHRGGTVQPLAYVRGLAGALLRAGGRIFTSTPATRLTRVAGRWAIETPGGTVSAPLAIIATNAYSGGLRDDLRRTVVAVPSFQVATAPMPAAVRAGILPEGHAASDTQRLLRYFRLGPGGRLVLGTRGTFAPEPRLSAMRHHYRAVRELFPQLAGLQFEYHWGGLVAMTRDSLPHLHELAPGLLAGLGYNGRGVAMATVMGRLLARRALGAAPAELGFPLTPLRPMPLHGLSGIGVRATIQYLRLADALTHARAS
jgi:glycine/D-amino acid oxidase-like deaminating enzyme